jgi:beta-glucanase (GH16 family)
LIKNLDSDSTSTDQNINNNFQLVWSDECNSDGTIDTSKWFQQTKLPTPDSWHNNEIQHYTDRIENSFNDSGYMHIVAKKETYTDQGVTKQYTSARLNSKFAFTYGRVEVRAQMPYGPGTWPAIWMLGIDHKSKGNYWYSRVQDKKPWPDCGEIDIIEHWGTNQDHVSSAIHTRSSYGRTQNKGGRDLQNVSTEFHVYTLEWTPKELVFSIDNSIHYTYNPEVKNERTWPFDKDLYLLLNVAVQPSISEDFTESPMIIDYVRVYQKTEN